MAEMYEKQEDGSLKPIEVSPELAKRVGIYLWLKAKSLEFEEIKFLCENYFNS